MRVERALLEELSEKVFNIGYQGELNHTQVIISCPVMFRDYPDAVASMVLKPPQGDLYPVSLTRDGNDLTWDVSAADVAIPGAGILQLTFTDGEGEEAEIIKTVYGAYSVNASLVANGEAPDPVQSWLDEAGAALSTFETEIGEIRKITTATDADEGKALSPKTVTNGKVTEWEYIDLADPDVVTQAVDDWLDDHPEATTTVQDGAITEAKLNDSLKEDLAWQDDVDELKNAIEQKANVDGYYEDLTAGNAEQLVGTVGVADSVPYNFRTTGGSADVGDRLKESAVIGGTVAWNQLVQNGNFSDGTNHWTKSDGTATVSGGECVYTPSAGTQTANIGLNSQSAMPFISGHIYLCVGTIKVNNLMSKSPVVYTGIGYSTLSGAQANSYYTYSFVSECNTTGTTRVTFYPWGTTQITFDGTQTATLKNIMCIDLTTLFGSTIATYIRTIEVATPGAGVAWFRKLFPKAYYAYNAGSLESVSTSKHREVEFNQWDEEWEIGRYKPTTGQKEEQNNTIRSKNYIPILPNTSYYCTTPSGFTIGHVNFCYYDANKNFISFVSNSTNPKTTPNNAYYMTFYCDAEYGTTYHNDICINLHWDGERDGEYEAYKVREYDLPNVVLRGIPKLDASNNLYYDGDELTPDGTVTRKYGIIDLGTLTWDKSNGKFYTTTMFGIKPGSNDHGYNNLICSKYVSQNAGGLSSLNDKCMSVDSGSHLQVYDSDYSSNTATEFKTSLSGVYLVYELATPTTESADPWQETQIVNDFGTEEYVDRLATALTDPRDVSIPVGHISTYQSNLRAKLEMSPDSPDGDGLYLVKQTSGQNEYVAYVPELPTNPNDNGTYTLKVTVSGSTKILAWVADT